MHFDDVARAMLTEFIYHSLLIKILKPNWVLDNNCPYTHEQRKKFWYLHSNDAISQIAFYAQKLQSYKIAVFREETTSVLTDFHVSSILVELEFGAVSFYGGKRTGEAEEKPSEHGENQ